MKALKSAVVIILGLMSFIAGANLGIPAIGALIRYWVYARPHLLDDIPVGGVAPASPVFNLATKTLLGLVLTAVGIALLKRYR